MNYKQTWVPTYINPDTFSAQHHLQTTHVYL